MQSLDLSENVKWKNNVYLRELAEFIKRQDKLKHLALNYNQFSAFHVETILLALIEDHVALSLKEVGL